MSVAASLVPPPVAVAPAPPSAPATVEREPAARPFAELLRQNRISEAPKSDAAKAATTPERATVRSDGDAPTAEADPAAAPIDEGTAQRSDGPRGRTRSGTSTSRPASRAMVGAERKGSAPERTSAQRESDDERASAELPSTSSTATPAPPMDPARSAEQALGPGATTHRAPPSAADSDPDSGTHTAFDAGPRGPHSLLLAADAGIAGRGPAVPRERAARRDAGEAIDGHDAAHAVGDDAATTQAASFARVLDDAKAADRAKGPPASASVEPSTSASALGATTPTPQGLGATQSAATSQAAAAPHAAALATPIESPEFAAAFGVQVSVFVREGVQHAELHLNPAETGPVSIAITLEGSRAHVEFGADLAATRQAIENGLPALASALRAAGFTLAGGGVAQHSRPGGGQGGDDSSRPGNSERRAVRDGDAAGIAAAAHHATRRVAAGGVDLYA